MDDDSSAGNSSRRQPSAVSSLKACEECRTRKIRCDRNRPCAHCRAANLVCRNNTQPTEARARVTISKQYENKIDRIENRLANIERLLRNGASTTSSPADAHQTPSSVDSQGGSKKPKRETADYLDDESAAATPFAGFTSMQAETLAAKDALEQTVGSSPSITQDRQLNEALSSLRNIVGRLKGDGNGPGAVSAPSPAPDASDEAGVPPWDQARVIVERAKPYPPAVFSMCLPCTPFETWVKKVEEMYDPHSDVSLAHKLIVFTGCVCLSGEFSALEKADSAEWFDTLSKSFQRATLKAIGELPLVVSPTWDNMEALLAAATVCIDMCKPSLSWTLTSVAARLIQVLGYHRVSTLSQDEPKERNRKLLMFWMTYIMDRNTSLRVGRTPSIQDYDVDVPRPQPSRDIEAPLLHLLNFWIDVSRVQGKICWLYSPGALSQTLEERSRMVNELAIELNRAYEARVKENDAILPIFTDPKAGFSTAEPMLEGDRIAYYTALTLVLQAIPATKSEQTPALEAARVCLGICRDLRQNFASNEYLWAGYCHWVILHNPLTPFTVVFGNVIAKHEAALDDLQLLEDYCVSLQPARRISEGVEKFYQLCSVFYKVAEAYVRAKQQESRRRIPSNKAPMGANQQWNQPLTGEFDEYLSALGFAPQTNVMPVTNDVNTMDTDMSAFMQQDWYTGNVSLYGLVEQDINNMGNWNFDMPADTWTADGSYRG
ncbi:hypothetical protein PRZ48_006293 [Zasmidium cellare]|uniref:Zn(2)-C6 fungal-type domain-containing protein n=1 Tax=Zasmidium cellare TaxID=395010 RepID=A0ABR0EN22_ZASCE|nr:hypothetical protein PRZ48_006293 [Zasmidium cellare]